MKNISQHLIRALRPVDPLLALVVVHLLRHGMLGQPGIGLLHGLLIALLELRLTGFLGLLLPIDPGQQVGNLIRALAPSLTKPWHCHPP
jgi:hypothetical protein